MTPTIRGIQIVVSARCGVSLKDLLSDRRGRAIARPRQIGVWLSWKLTDRTLPQIATAFGRRDHTTVMYSIKLIDEQMAKDPKFRETVENVWKTAVGIDVRPNIPHVPQPALEASETQSKGVRIKPPALGGGAIRSSLIGVGPGSHLNSDSESLCQSQRAH